MTSSDMTSDALRADILASIDARETHEAPYRWHVLSDVVSAQVVAAIHAVPADMPDVGAESGRREIHNKSRSYFDAETRASQPVAEAVCAAFQDGRTVRTIQDAFATDLDGTSLRVEYALDTDGFWLEPHTDLGVKRFTLLLYLSDGHADLGTDVYDAERRAVAPLALRAGRRHGLRAWRRHLSRLREAPDRRRSPLPHRQLRHARLARPRAACLSGYAGDSGLTRRSPSGPTRRPSAPSPAGLSRRTPAWGDRVGRSGLEKAKTGRRGG